MQLLRAAGPVEAGCVAMYWVVLRTLGCGKSLGEEELFE